MEILCPRCAEPFEIDALHDVGSDFTVLPDGRRVDVSTFKKAKDVFFTYGCGTLFYGQQCAPAEGANRTRAEFSRALHDLMGDDLDGIASELEDAEYFGLI